MKPFSPSMGVGPRLMLLAMLVTWLARVASAQAPPRLVSWGLSGDDVVLSWVGEAPAYRVETASTLDADQWSEVFVTRGTSASMPANGTSAYFRVRALSPAEASTLVEEAPARVETLQRIREVVAAQPGIDRVAERSAIARYLEASVPEVSEVRIQNDCVWGRFPDGKWLTIVDNRLAPEEEQRLPDAAPPQAPIPEFERAVPPRGARDAADGSTGIPESNKAYVFSSRLIANIFNEGPERHLFDYRLAGDLTTWLRDNGYAAVNWVPSLTALSQVKNAGLFYYEGHSAVINPGTPSEDWILTTDTTIEQSISNEFRNDIGYAIFKPRPGKVHYALLRPFFGKHMTFGKNAFVCINSCHSLPAKDSFGPPKPAFAGWTDKTLGSDAFRAGRYLFDRLLGANRAKSFHPYTLDLGEDPPQRPFSYFRTLEAMMASGLNTSQVEEDGITTIASLGIQSGDGFGILAPSIQRMWVDEVNEQLQIWGLFDGQAQSATAVTWNQNTALQVVSVAADRIVCALPISLKPSVGDIQVRQRGHRSNAVPLTEWWVTGTLVKWFAKGVPTPSATTEINLHFRADVHESRPLPHAKPVHFPTSAQLAKDSHAKVLRASGTYHYPPDTAPGSVEWMLNNPVDVPFTRLHGTLGIGADGHCQLTAGALAGSTMTVVNRDGEGNFLSTYLSEPGTRSFPPGETRISWSTYLINSGHGSAAGDSGTFSWSVALPVHPPRGDYAR